MGSKSLSGLTTRALAVLALGGLLAIALEPGLRGAGGAGGEAGAASKPQGINKITHIVFLVKENRSFDHMFGAFPGVAGTRTGVLSNGKSVPLIQASDRIDPDPAHDY